MNIDRAAKMLGMSGKICRNDLWLRHIAIVQENLGKTRIVDKFLNSHDGQIGQYFIPFEYFKKHAGQHFSPSMLSLAYGWAFGGVEVHFDMWMFEQLLDSDPTDEAPLAWLDMLPGWTVHFPISEHAIDNSKPEISGWFLAHRKNETQDVLIFGSPTPDGQAAIQVLIIEPTEDGFFRLRDTEGNYIDSKIFQIVVTFLFFCTLTPHTPAPVKVSKQMRKGGVIDHHIHLKDEPSIIQLYAQQKEYLSSHNTDRDMIQSERKAHMRRAHWRSVWLGPRDGEQRKELRWIPPTFVRGFKAE